MENKALEIIKSVLDLVKQRDALFEELEITKGLLEGAISAQETLQQELKKARDND